MRTIESFVASIARPGAMTWRTLAATVLAVATILPAYGDESRRGDAARGRGLADTCTPCHGPAGVSESPAFPILAGQQYDYLLTAMQAYLSGTRQDSIMSGAIRTLSRAELEDLAAYYASQRGDGGLGSRTAATIAAAPTTVAPPWRGWYACRSRGWRACRGPVRGRGGAWPAGTGAAPQPAGPRSGCRGTARLRTGETRGRPHGRGRRGAGPGR